jgi:hypothetical protein
MAKRLTVQVDGTWDVPTSFKSDPTTAQAMTDLQGVIQAAKTRANQLVTALDNALPAAATVELQQLSVDGPTVHFRIGAQWEE